MNNLVFLNIAKYIAEFKFAIENLYAEYQVVMSSSARNDLDRIKPEAIIQIFTLPALKQWQKGNQLLNIHSYSDFLNSQLGIIGDVRNSRKSKSKNAGNNRGRRLSESELKLVVKCFSQWDKFTNLFYDQIENIDTLKLLLKNGETQISILNGLETSLDKSDPVVFYNEKLSRLCDNLRTRILSLEYISPVVSESTSEARLRTNITPEFLQSVLLQLSEARYISGDYESKPTLAEQWYNYAFVPRKGKNKSSRRVTIKWISTSRSMAQFIVVMCEGKAFLYQENDKSNLYKWTHRCFSSPWGKSTIEKDMRKALTAKNQHFELLRNRNGEFAFRVLQKARRPKGLK